LDALTKTLSTSLTFLIKVVFPILWMGGYSVAALILFARPGIWPGENGGPVDPLLKWVCLCASVVGGLFIWWCCIRLKRVRMDDRALYISNYRTEIVVPLTHVARVSEYLWAHSHPVTIEFRAKTEFGSRIVFEPKARLFGPLAMLRPDQRMKHLMRNPFRPGNTRSSTLGGPMIRRPLLGLLVAVVLAACSSARTAPPTLAGNWAPLSAELGGQVFPVANFAGATLRLTTDTYEFAGDKGTYAVVSTSPPAKMDIHGQVGPNAGRTIQAIYELTGDQLTVCYQLGAGERPGEFQSTNGSQVLLIRYKRVQ
jgi:uncharacterized protein (TIGR03067 family)